MQSEMDNCNQLISSTWLEESVLDVGEWDLNVETLSRRISDTILVDLQVTDGPSTLQVRLDRDILEHISLTLDQLDWLNMVLLIFLLLVLLVNDLSLFDQIFDLLFDLSQVVVLSTIVLVFESQFLDVDCIWFFQLWELESA